MLEQGWDVSSFPQFSPLLMQLAVQQAVYARRVGPMLGSHRAMLTADLTGLPNARKPDVAAAKLRSQRAIPILEELLGLSDGD